jgi:hypothetical protein
MNFKVAPKSSDTVAALLQDITHQQPSLIVVAAVCMEGEGATLVYTCATGCYSGSELVDFIGEDAIDLTDECFVDETLERIRRHAIMQQTLWNPKFGLKGTLLTVGLTYEQALYVAKTLMHRDDDAAFLDAAGIAPL